MFYKISALRRSITKISKNSSFGSVIDRSYVEKGRIQLRFKNQTAAVIHLIFPLLFLIVSAAAAVAETVCSTHPIAFYYYSLHHILILPDGPYTTRVSWTSPHVGSFSSSSTQPICTEPNIVELQPIIVITGVSWSHRALSCSHSHHPSIHLSAALAVADWQALFYAKFSTWNVPAAVPLPS